MLGSSALKKLAERFPVPLYIVGGAVRDFLSGAAIHDYDLASALTTDEVIALFPKNSDVSVSTTSKKMGTLKIKFKGESYEYTSFREDSYGSDGNHLPTAVSFTRDLKSDAFRRDFTVNAIYYDLLADRYEDPTGGKRDLERRLLRATRNPEVVFGEDALRILRLIRIAAETGFDIEKETFEGAKRCVSGLKEISVERLRDEFDKMLVADTVNGISNAEIRAINLAVEIGAMDYIVPEYAATVGCLQRPDYHAYDVSGHTLKCVEYCPPSLRLAAFFHDLAKPVMKAETGHMIGHDKRGVILTRNRLNALRYPKDVIKRTVKLVGFHMYDLKCEAKDTTIALFVQENKDIIYDLARLMDADRLASGTMTGKSATGERLVKKFDEMKKAGVPFSVSELKVSGEDLIALDIPNELRSECLKSLLKECALNSKFLTREAQYEYLVKYKLKH